MFQFCNLCNHVYTGSRGCTAYIPDKVAVLDYDDLIIEIVPGNLFTPDILNNFVAVRRVGFTTQFRDTCDEAPHSNIFYWIAAQKHDSAKFFFRGLPHEVRLKLSRQLYSSGNEGIWGTVYYDRTGILNFDCGTEDCILCVNYAFIHGNYLIVRMSIFEETAQYIICPRLNFSFVFLDEKLIGCYVTWTSYVCKVFKPLDSDLEAKLTFFLKDKY